MVHRRIAKSIKAQAAQTLAVMGLSGLDAVRVLPAHTVAKQQLPFDPKAPNAETRAAMQESRAIMATRRARFKI